VLLQLLMRALTRRQSWRGEVRNYTIERRGIRSEDMQRVGGCRYREMSRRECLHKPLGSDFLKILPGCKREPWYE